MTDSFFDQQFARANAIIDKFVGDAIDFRAAPTADATVIQGYVLPDEDRPAFNGDEARSDNHVLKINKSILPALAGNMRFAHKRLGDGWFKRTNVEPKTLGDYWLFSVQKVPS